jgi:hypothetical protein
VVVFLLHLPFLAAHSSREQLHLSVLGILGSSVEG